MAKPIRSTPELEGHKADEFLKKMLKVEESRVTYQQKEFAKEIKKNMNLLQVC